MRYGSTVLAVMVSFLMVSRAFAQETATAKITQTSGGPTFHYSVSVTNTSASSNIGTFWFAWEAPPLNYDLMTSMPTVTSTPSSWTAIPTNAGVSDGYSIEWYNLGSTTSDIAPGQTFTFGFSSADSLTSLTGNSTHFIGQPVLTSVVYAGFPESDAGFTFVVSAPEPTSLAILGVGIAGMCVRRRRRA